MKDSKTVICIDGNLRNWGVVVFDYRDGAWALDEGLYYHNKKISKAGKTKAARAEWAEWKNNTAAERTMEEFSRLISWIEALIKIKDPDAVVIEMPAGSQSAAGLKANIFIYVWSIFMGILHDFDMLWVTAYDVKEACTGDRRGSKERVEAFVSKTYAASREDLQNKYNKGAVEHIMDAFGVFHAAKPLLESKFNAVHEE